MNAIITFRQENGDTGSGEIKNVTKIETLRELYDGEHREVVQITSADETYSRAIRKENLLNIFIR